MTLLFPMNSYSLTLSLFRFLVLSSSTCFLSYSYSSSSSILSLIPLLSFFYVFSSNIFFYFYFQFWCQQWLYFFSSECECRWSVTLCCLRTGRSNAIRRFQEQLVRKYFFSLFSLVFFTFHKKKIVFYFYFNCFNFIILFIELYSSIKYGFPHLISFTLFFSGAQECSAAITFWAKMIFLTADPH